MQTMIVKNVKTRSFSRMCIGIVLPLALTACGTLRQNRLPVLSASDVIIRSYIERENYSALIESLSIYPEQYGFVTNYLINADYTGCSYDKLTAYEVSSASDSILSSFYTNLREEYEDDVMETLSVMSIEDIAEYYKRHPEEERFLKPFLERSIAPTIVHGDYFYLRELHDAFSNTEIATIVDSTWAARRRDLLPIVMETTAGYFQAEQDVLLHYKEHTLMQIDSMIRDNLPKIVDRTLNVFNEGVLNLLFVEIKYDRTPLRQRIQEYSDSLFNTQSIHEIIQNDLDNAKSEFSHGRDMLHDNLFHNSKTSFPEVTPIHIEELSLPRVHRYYLDQIDVYTDKSIRSRNISSLISMGIGLIPGAGWVIKGADIAMGVGDIVYATVSNTKEGKAIQEYVANFSDKFCKDLYDYLRTYIEAVYDSEQVVLNDEQTALTEIIYEKF